MSRRFLSAIFGMALLCFAAPSQALAKVHVEIQRGSQKMNVFVDGKLKHSWAVSPQGLQDAERGFQADVDDQDVAFAPVEDGTHAALDLL